MDDADWKEYVLKDSILALGTEHRLLVATREGFTTKEYKASENRGDWTVLSLDYHGGNMTVYLSKPARLHTKKDEF